MRFWLIGCLALAACEEGAVLEVHIAPGSQATMVKLFVGFEQCFDDQGRPCPGLAPPSSVSGIQREMLPGDVYHREPFEDETKVREAKVENGVARFRIEASSGHSKLPFAVAVDEFNESAAFIDELSLDGAVKYRVNLARADGVLDRPSMPTTNVVEIWNQPTRMLPCMGFERWQDGELARERVFVVPSDDLDCDEIGPNECAPYAYKGVKPPPFEATSCLDASSVGDVALCRPGGPSCAETGGDTTCVPSEYCLPSHYCSVNNPSCVERLGIVNVERCLFNSEPSTTAYVECTVGLTPSNDNTHNDLCRPEIAIDFDNTIGVQCVKPDTDKLLLAQSSSANPTEPAALGFQQIVPYQTVEGTTLERVAITAKVAYQFDCVHKLVLEGDAVKGANVQFEYRSTFMQVWVRNGGPIRKLLVPLVLKTSPICAETACKVVVSPNDQLATCALR